MYNTLESLHAGNFAIVMASGILSVGLSAHGYTRIAATNIVGILLLNYGFNNLAIACWFMAFACWCLWPSHATTNYDMLRVHDVQLGKLDFLGAMRIGTGSG